MLGRWLSHGRAELRPVPLFGRMLVILNSDDVLIQILIRTLWPSNVSLVYRGPGSLVELLQSVQLVGGLGLSSCTREIFLLLASENWDSLHRGWRCDS